MIAEVVVVGYVCCGGNTQTVLLLDVEDVTAKAGPGTGSDDDSSNTAAPMNRTRNK